MVGLPSDVSSPPFVHADFRVIPRDCADELGEGPTWSAREQRLYWVDIMKPAVYAYEPGSCIVETWLMPEMIGWLVEREHHPGFIGGFAGGFALMQFRPLSIVPIGDPEPDLPDSRMNDAKVDHRGRLWAGTMDHDARRAIGALYRLDPDHRWHRLDEGYSVSNGPAFSADGRYLYHTDSWRRTIYRFELDEAGGLHDKRPFITFNDQMGYPDGMTTDIEGCLWITHYGGGCVSRFSPRGERLKALHLPVSQVTSCAFGGPRLERLYLTTAAYASQEALAGAVFEIDAGVCGLPQTAFAG